MLADESSGFKTDMFKLFFFCSMLFFGTPAPAQELL